MISSPILDTKTSVRETFDVLLRESKQPHTCAGSMCLIPRLNLKQMAVVKQKPKKAKRLLVILEAFCKLPKGLIK